MRDAWWLDIDQTRFRDGIVGRCCCCFFNASVDDDLTSIKLLEAPYLRGWGSTLLGILVRHLTVARHRRASVGHMARVATTIPLRLSCSDF
eukprot:45052-Prymnesium_polylepis.2